MNKKKLAILRNEVAEDHLDWVNACKEMSQIVDYQIIDITLEDWMEQITSQSFDGLLALPSGWTTPFKTLYDERLYILHTILGYPIFPSMEEIQIYENKKYLSYWLKANKVPHPRTWVFYHEKEALQFLKTATLPLVAKMSIGGGGNGVQILKTRGAVRHYILKTFSGHGTTQSVGPKWRNKGFFKRVIHKLRHLQELKNKFIQYQHLRSEVQKDFVLFQEFIPHTFEWRAVRIGDSFFAHKKLIKGEKASGSLLKGYENPPLELMDFLKAVTDKRGFLSQAVDMFEPEKGQYLVNEMQCIFGQSDPYQMLVDGTPGRYRNIQGKWVFEPGDFNRNASFLLRLEYFLEILSKNESPVPA
ncbi:MAG: hypothetical protein H6563_12355 [Lewinellaceae bacterium]|nr:hypothetical protein [Lewinellaceae bacterium]